MNPRPVEAADALRLLDRFSAVIDVRSPSEFALDHVPGAQNWPVLDDAQRAEIGTIYKQVDPFVANKRGAALVARNIAAHLDHRAADLPKSWAPLVYCWRGGNRSGAMAHVLAQVGFSVAVVRGGYRALRSALCAELDALPDRIDFRVICGRTGCGKSRLLQALRAAGAQVLDLENLARHRGSVLGLEPGAEQPSQKAFESQLWAALRGFDPARPVYVESESKKVGSLHVPDALMARIRAGRCIALELDDAARVAFLLRDYAALAADLPLLHARLDALRALRGAQTVERWKTLTAQGDLATFTAEILQQHYDPSYIRSMPRNFAGFGGAATVLLGGIEPEDFTHAAQAVLRLESTMRTQPDQAQALAAGG